MTRLWVAHDRHGSHRKGRPRRHGYTHPPLFGRASVAGGKSACSVGRRWKKPVERAGRFLPQGHARCANSHTAHTAAQAGRVDCVSIERQRRPRQHVNAGRHNDVPSREPRPCRSGLTGRTVCSTRPRLSCDPDSCHFDWPAMSSSPHAFRGVPQAEVPPARRDNRVCGATLANAVQQQLRASPYLALRSLRCRAEGERLVLEGRVGSYYLKQLASAVAQRAGEGCWIDNRLEVVAGASIFWLDEEEPAVDPLSGRWRGASASAPAPRDAAPAASSLA